MPFNRVNYYIVAILLTRSYKIHTSVQRSVLNFSSSYSIKGLLIFLNHPDSAFRKRSWEPGKNRVTQFFGILDAFLHNSSQKTDPAVLTFFIFSSYFTAFSFRFIIFLAIVWSSDRNSRLYIWIPRSSRTKALHSVCISREASYEELSDGLEIRTDGFPMLTDSEPSTAAYCQFKFEPTQKPRGLLLPNDLLVFRDPISSAGTQISMDPVDF